MKAKYLAEIQFTNGKSANARDNNLRSLKARIDRNFSGEQTDWGFTATGVVSSACIFEAGKRVLEIKKQCVSLGRNGVGFYQKPKPVNGKEGVYSVEAVALGKEGQVLWREKRFVPASSIPELL